MNNKPLSVADFINLANRNVGEGLLRTGENNFELAKSLARQEAIGFFIWYGVKMAGFIHYIMDIRAIATSQEIEEKIIEFEGKPIHTLFDLYLESKTSEKEK